MKKYLLGILVIFVSACGNSSTSLDQNQTDILPIVFSKQLTGKIGDNLSITMSLERNDSILNGKYYYHGQEGFLMLSGRYFGKNEIDNKEKPTIILKVLILEAQRVKSRLFLSIFSKH